MVHLKELGMNDMVHLNKPDTNDTVPLKETVCRQYTLDNNVNLPTDMAVLASKEFLAGSI